MNHIILVDLVEGIESLSPFRMRRVVLALNLDFN